MVIICVYWSVLCLNFIQNESKPGLDAYKLVNVKMAKRLWRIAVEHHAFFR